MLEPADMVAVSTLRVLLQDQLFVRAGPAMKPTSRATSLAGPVREALGAMQAALHASANFDPATEQRTFRLGFSSEVELLLLPALAAELRRTAPGIRVIGRQTEREDAHRMLDDGTVDLTVGCFEKGAERHKVQRLFEQSLSCVFHPKLLPAAAMKHGIAARALGRMDDDRDVLRMAAARIAAPAGS